MKFARGGKTVKERRDFTIIGGMCAQCEGRGSVTDFRLDALFDADKAIRDFTASELEDLLHKEPTKIKVDGINLT